MPNTGLSKFDIEQIKIAISQYKDTDQVTLFGSRAKGTYKKGPDTDIAIKLNTPKPSTLQLIHDSLEETTPYLIFLT